MHDIFMSNEKDRKANFINEIQWFHIFLFSNSIQTKWRWHFCQSRIWIKTVDSFFFFSIVNRHSTIAKIFFIQTEESCLIENIERSMCHMYLYTLQSSAWLWIQLCINQTITILLFQYLFIFVPKQSIKFASFPFEALPIDVKILCKFKQNKI